MTQPRISYVCPQGSGRQLIPAWEGLKREGVPLRKFLSTFSNFFQSSETWLIAFNCPQPSDIISDQLLLVHSGRKWPHFLYSHSPFLSQKAGPKSFITKYPLHVLVTERAQSSFSLLLSFFFSGNFMVYVFLLGIRVHSTPKKNYSCYEKFVLAGAITKCLYGR